MAGCYLSRLPRLLESTETGIQNVTSLYIVQSSAGNSFYISYQYPQFINCGRCLKKVCASKALRERPKLPYEITDFSKGSKFVVCRMDTAELI